MQDDHTFITAKPHVDGLTINVFAGNFGPKHDSQRYIPGVQQSDIQLCRNVGRKVYLGAQPGNGVDATKGTGFLLNGSNFLLRGLNIGGANRCAIKLSSLNVKFTSLHRPAREHAIANTLQYEPVITRASWWDHFEILAV